MDSIVHAALEEICSEGATGIHLSDLWLRLLSPLTGHGIHPCDNVKKELWSNLLHIPSLQFQSKGTLYDSTDSIIQSVVESERLKLKIVASEKLRNCSVGVYDVKTSDANLSKIQRHTLKRLADARNAGIMQSELAKEFNMKGNSFFYVLRQLECRGLIVRQSAIVKTKESNNEGGEFKNGSIVHTNMVYLRRYAQNLGCQQRLEIIKEDKLLDFNDAMDEGSVKEDVHINDYLPALKAICDKLEQANGKVLVVADIKCELGYKLKYGHRAWRNMCKRLKDASVVEEFYAKVNNKEVNCLRLLKSFSPSKFKQKGFRENDLDAEQPISSNKRGKITEQLMELPIEHRIYDMVDAEGPKGLTINDIIKRLGLNNKRYYKRLINMFSRLGMPLEAENHNRCVAYRVWTHKNFNPEASKKALISSENVASENVSFDLRQRDNSLGWEVAILNKSEQTNKMINIKDGAEKTNNLIEQELPNESPVTDLCLATSEPASDFTPEKSSLSTRRRRRCYQTYPCLTPTLLNNQREEMILQRLEEEKFIIRAELHRHLENLEGDKQKLIDRKTLDRCLNKIQQEGHCKLIRVSVPSVSNCSSHKSTDVVLHPSVQDVSPELLCQIHEKLNSFGIEIRSQCSFRLKKGKTLPVLDSIQRIDTSPIKNGKFETMRANGFVLAKMVRSKLLHKYLWSYISSINQGHDQHDSHSTCRLFRVDEVIKAFPLELFCQVVGSTQTFDDMIEKCKSGLHLGDLTKEEYTSLMDTNATGRLSLIIDILRRLKLIRLVEDGHPKEQPLVATLTYALELKPYIEEPLQIFKSSIPHDHHQPETRHDFVLSSQESVDEYWNTLEYIYATAEPKMALHAFPGCAVHEICIPRSWSLLRVMTADQRAKLLERVDNADPNLKLQFKDCEKIAKELDLTIEQVLRVSYDKNQKRLTRFREQLNGDEEVHKGGDASSSKRRKRRSERKSRKRVKKGNSDRPSSEQVLTGPLVTESQPPEEQCPSSNYGGLKRDLDARQVEDGLDATGENDGAMSLSTQKQKKFFWTEDSERQLVIEYVRHRAALGAKFFRTDWGSLPNLPAPPETCKRRMTLVNYNLKIRKCIMRLCNMMSERYAKHMEKLKSNQDIDNVSVASDKVESQEKLITLETWDDFDNEAAKLALDEILKLREIARQEASEKDALDTESHSLFGFREDGTTISRRRSRSQRFTQKYLMNLESGTCSYKRVHESLAVSNAIELFKLVFMSTSVAPGIQNLLAETLRRYSKDDLFAAFNYLKEKKAMVGGTAGNPFCLSQHFVQSISSSPFPVNTGRRAAKFSSWLREQENDLMEDEIDLSADLQCGDVFQLCALLFSEELSIIPNLPDNGVGEANDSRKRKSENSDSGMDDSVKRYKSSTAGEGEIISRREKGFPGIRLSVTRNTISGTNALFRFSDHHSGTSGLGQLNGCPISSDLDKGCSLSHSVTTKEKNEQKMNTTLIANASSPWEVMTSYANHFFQLPNQVEESIFNPELFRTIHLAIQKAGDQGLSIEEVSKLVNLKEANMSEIIIEVLEVFGRALKVNAYNSVHVVDSSYSSKYLLASVAKADTVSLQRHLGVYVKEDTVNVSESNVTNTTGESMNADTTPNISKVSQPSETHVKLTYNDQNDKNKTLELHHENTGIHRLILPWLNGDGTVNKIFYKGYQRRLLAIVMQNPGILEDDIVKRMGILNPQSCKSLLKLMVLDNYITVRKMLETTSSQAPPSILNRLIGDKFRSSKLTYIEHFFANPKSCTLL
ncbi:uncharacterized protein LOC124944847 [Impatiens glandulifera]|uniref:uncharacterized protein LOC124944847 n=1 Tax=Impatiens glandulifera TaxID=253017 RepID=UPI001FB14C29|nr:uncharacterized protein LOC124944847 [Impatiens glandulifera]